MAAPHIVSQMNKSKVSSKASNVLEKINVNRIKDKAVLVEYSKVSPILGTAQSKLLLARHQAHFRPVD